MPPVHVTLLGGFHVRLGSGSAVALPTRKAQALLAYLALPVGTAHPRDKLAALLWGGIREDSARASLRQALFAIRKALGDDATAALRQDGDALVLDAAAVEVDATSFAEAIKEASPASLAQAAELYRGDLLAGLVIDEAPFEEWLLGERERLRELALEALAKLLGHQRRSATPEAATQTALRLLTLDPLQEPVHRVLMRLYADLGRRGAALRQYQQCVGALQRELGTEPETETKQLYEEILRARSSRSSLADVGDAKSSRPAVAVLPSARRSSAFVGRAAEIARLRAVLDGAVAGRGAVTALVGEAGIGKSRLLSEVAAEAISRQMLVLTGRAYESEQILPFGPWVDALRAAGLARDAALLDRLGATWRSELTRLLPELGDAPRDGGDPRRIFEAVVAVLGHLAAAQPLLLVLEDLHWADEMSARLLAFVGRRLQARVAIIVSARAEEFDEAGALGRGLDELDREGHLTRVPVVSLSREDSDILVRALARSGSAEEDLERLAAHAWTVSGGNPFVIVEAVQGTVEGAAVTDAAVLTLPERVREVVNRRLVRLSDRARALAAVAAVIGREFDFALLQHAAASDEQATASGLEELVRRGILHGAGECFDFTHDRIRETVSGAILPPRRRLLHRQVAEALEGIHGANLDAHQVALGTHYRESSQWDKAATYLGNAGIRASNQSAYREAVALLEQALAALEQLPESRRRAEQQIDLLRAQANSLTPMGQLERALENNRRRAAIARDIGDDERLMGALVHDGYVLASLGDLAGAIGVVEEAMALADRIAKPELKTTFNAARLYYGVGDYGRAIEFSRAEIAAHVGSRLHARTLTGISAAVRGRVWLTLCLAELGEFHEGAVVTEEAARLARRADFAHDQVWSSVGSGRLFVVQGDLQHAIDALEPALPRCRPGSELVIYFSRIAASLGLAYVLSGRMADGVALLEEAVAVGESIRFVYMQSLALACLAEGRVVAGKAEDAVRAATQAIDLARNQGHRGWEAWAWRARGEAARLGGDAASATHDLHQAMTLAEERGMRPLLAHCRFGLGGAAERCGDRALAREHMATALAAYRAMAMPYWISRAEGDLARLA